MSTSDFGKRYLETWTEPDTEQRHENVRAMWADDGKMTVSSIGATLEGVDKIVEHIDRVHDEMIAGKGIVFDYTQQIESGDALLLVSSVSTPAGDVVGKGGDVIFRDGQGRVTAAHMFMGLN